MTLLLCPVLSVCDKDALHMSITWRNTRYDDAIGREACSCLVFLNLFVYHLLKSITECFTVHICVR